jgi:hypothetical protein
MGSLLRFKLDDFLSNYHLQTFIETGTARGDSLDYAAQRPEFSHLLSCEIEPLLAAGACCRFNEDARISVVRMESGLFMQMVARADLAPALIWLDAHYPGAGFGLKDYGAAMPETVRLPLGRELDQIRQHRQGRDVILIDDLRIYETGDYEAGPLPEDAPGQPTEGGADWIRALFADTHEARTILRDQGYLLLLPKPSA